MKKLSIFLLNLFIIGVIFAQNNADQNSSVIRKIRQNEVITLYGGDIERIQREFENYEIRTEVVGWSQNGLFACRTRFYNYGRPGSGYNLIIFNTVNDRILENDELYTSAPFEEFPSNELIAETRNRWNELLRIYGIIGQIRNPVEEINEGGYQMFERENFECWFNYEIYGDGAWNEEINWRLMAEISGKQKIVSSKTMPSYLYGEKIMGFYKSPYENRIVILALRQGREFMIQPDFYGCHLNVGFN